MKKKIFIRILIVLSLCIITGCKQKKQTATDKEDGARRTMVVVGSQHAQDAAASYFAEASVKGQDGIPKSNGESLCITIKELVDKGYYKMPSIKKYEYSGKVIITKLNNTYLYNVWLQVDKKYMVVNKGSDGTTRIKIESTDVEEYNETSFSDTCN